MSNILELEKFTKSVKYRDQQVNLLFDLLVRQNRFIYPVLHLYGLSGTGKTFLTKKFMNRFCNGSITFLDETTSSSKSRKTANRHVCKKFHIYLNCREMCHNSTLSLFHGIVEQVQNILIKQNEEFELEDEPELCITDIENVEKSSDCSNYIRQLKYMLSRLSNNTTKCMPDLHN
jgi:hypothetical protein